MAQTGEAGRGAIGARTAGHRLASARRTAVRLMDRVGPTVAAWREEEAGRFILWAPVFLAMGVAVYFALPSEPPPLLAIGPVLLTLGAFGFTTGGRRWIEAWGVRAALAFLIGISLAMVRTAAVAEPVLSRPVGPAPVNGILVEREDRSGDQRLTIAVETIGALRAKDTPAKVRVTWRGEPTSAVPGDRISVFGQLFPPPGPALPGGFDYGRQLYFDRIGGTGFLYAEPRIVAASDNSTVVSRVRTLRTRIADRIERLTPGKGAPVAAALVTGERDGIPPDITDALRDTGLAHLLAISGLHMGLVCGFLFAAVRWGLVLHEGLAASRPVRQWAAGIALAGGTAYLALSGASVSAERAYVMAAIGFFAIMVGRRAISLRNVALAAIVIIILTPEEVVSAGFQMSFAAVTALVATYDEVQRRRRSRGAGPLGPMGKAAAFFGALLLTSVIAGMATAPMAIHHFGRVAVYGLPANLLVMPLFSLVVMPGAVIGLVAMPFGLDGPVWYAVGHALGALLSLTEWMAGQEGAVVTVAAGRQAGFLLVLAGGVLLFLLRAPWRLGGVPVMAAGGLVFSSLPPADLFIARDLANVGVVQDSRLDVLSRRRARFERRRWGEALGLADGIEGRLADCADGASYCVLIPNPGAGDIVWAPTVDDAARACRQSSVVIAPVWEEPPLRESCGARLVTHHDAVRHGAMTVRMVDGRPRLQTVSSRRGTRPWSPPAQ